jgi:hypothetical protein
MKYLIFHVIFCLLAIGPALGQTDPLKDLSKIDPSTLRPTRDPVIGVEAKEGETVRELAIRVGADPDEIARYNGLLPGTKLNAGRMIEVPDPIYLSGLAEMHPDHARTLRRYLGGNKANKFRTVSAPDSKYLAVMRQSFGPKFTPSYAVGDFDGDKIEDFAVLLDRTGGAVVEGDPGFPLTIVIFEGQGNGRYRDMFREDLMGPTAAFIRYEKGRKARLYYAVFESDADTFTIRHTSKGYVAEAEKPR